MIPILYTAVETEFTSNGLGKLSDALSCKVTEVRNGEFELSMTYPITGLHYSDLAPSHIISAVPADGKKRQAFRIYKISKPLNGVVTVDARHISYQLSYIPVKAISYNVDSAASALSTLKSKAIEPCPFDFWTDVDTRAKFTIGKPASIRSLLGDTHGSVLDQFGGEYEWDNWTVKLHKQRGYDTGIILRYGKNITDIKQEESVAGTITGVLPYWAKDSEEGESSTWLSAPVYTENADKFPYHMTNVLDVTQDFTEKPTGAQMKQKALQYINANDLGKPSVNITISFVPLWQTIEYQDIAPLERVNLCDRLKVVFPALNVSVDAKVVKTVYDVLKDRYESIEIGDARTSLSDVIAGTTKTIVDSKKETSSFLQKAIEHATKLIQGGLGGHVVMGTNADGEPNEILVMDTDNISTAVNVIRINVNGIGFSTNGYNGPFTTAWTIDGKFNADFIAAGAIRAGLITTGTIQDAKASNYWNLETGTFHLAANTSVGGSTIAAKTDLTTAVSDYDTGLNQEKVFNKLTNNGQTQGIYLQDGKLYINADYISSGILTANLLKAGIIQVGDTNAVGSLNAYKYGTKFLTISSDGLLMNAHPWLSSGVYIDMRPNIFDGMAIAQNEDHTGSAVGLSYDEVQVKNNSSTLSTTVMTNNASYMKYNEFSIIGDSMVDVMFKADSGGNMSCRGTKSRVVETQDYGLRQLYCYETPSPLFGDVGEGVIGEDGLSYIQVDPTFQETITTSQYQVFLQVYGDGSCYVKERHPSFFVVSGTPGVSFGFEMKAKQSDFDQRRLEKVEPERYEKQENYGEKANTYLQSIYRERQVTA